MSVILEQIRTSPSQLRRLLDEGRKAIGRLLYYTSGAGLWSRGASLVKALVPYNVGSLLPGPEVKAWVEAGKIGSAGTTEDVLKIAGWKPQEGESAVQAAQKLIAGWKPREGEDPERAAKSAIAENLVDASKATVKRLTERARSSPEALTPLDLKLATVAIQSARAGTYLRFKIGTSVQTHEEIRQYLQEFKRTYQNKVFHSDPRINRRIKDAIGRYLAEDERRGETHLFGYQVGLHAMDAKTGEPVSSTVPIGEGAGKTKAYFDESGLTAQMQEEGIVAWFFENIEVASDPSLLMGAHLRTGKPVSVVLVPTREGYKGGSPFMVTRDGVARMELHEGSALPREYAEGNPFFNTNTIVGPMNATPSENVGFETKNTGHGRIVRSKMNAGDITKELDTGGIVGGIGYEYENFKSLQEFVDNGPKLIDTVRAMWERDLAPTRSPKPMPPYQATVPLSRYPADPAKN